MKINFSKKEYATLIELLEIADWILHSHLAGKSNEDFDKKYINLIQQIYSRCKEFHLEDRFEKEPSTQKFYLKDEYSEEIIEEHVTKYNNDFFYEELIDRLSHRDAVNELGWEKYKALNFEDRLTILHKYEESYQKEFEKNGLKYLFVKSIDE